MDVHVRHRLACIIKKEVDLGGRLYYILIDLTSIRSILKRRRAHQLDRELNMYNQPTWHAIVKLFALVAFSIVLPMVCTLWKRSDTSSGVRSDIRGASLRGITSTSARSISALV